MREQFDLLRSTPWQTLIICDSLRADEAPFDFAQGREPVERQAEMEDVEAVRSLAPITFEWVRRFAATFGREELLLLCANPVVNRELRRLETCWAQVPCWLWDWETAPDGGLPTVPASAVVQRLWRVMLRHGRPARMIVWLLQPHVPYPGIPYSDWGRGMADPLSKAICGTPTIRQALNQGLVGWDQILAGRRQNVRIALEAAQRVAQAARGLCVLTSDHGELLGETGEDGLRLFGHAGDVGSHPALREVPWIEWDAGPIDPSPLPPHPAWWDDGEIESKLEALGYA